jgi:hypothetical protein
MEEMTQGEKAANQGTMRKLYKLSGKYGKLEKPVKDKEGREITEEEGQRNRWMEHFQEQLNRPTL